MTVQFRGKQQGTEVAQVAGQLGGTGTSPDVRGLRETGGPTLLTVGAIADGEYGKRVGSTFVGGTPTAAPSPDAFAFDWFMG